MLERIKNNIVALDIISKAVLTRSDSILAFAGKSIFELFDIVSAGAAVGVVTLDYFGGANLLEVIAVFRVYLFVIPV